eukprot:NODE_1_length_95616_cov_0.657642.p16 type:complete len:400 gc:universal NODE_1_length_95616_cov_0.657642:38775-39974(+)
MLKSLKIGLVNTCGVVTFKKEPKRASNLFMLVFFIMDSSIDKGIMVLYFDKFENMPKLKNGDIVYLEGYFQRHGDKTQIKASRLLVHPFVEEELKSLSIISELLSFSKTLSNRIEVTLLSDFTPGNCYGAIVQIKFIDFVAKNRVFLKCTDYSQNSKLLSFKFDFDDIKLPLLNCVCWDEMANMAKDLNINDFVRFSAVKTKLDACGYIEAAARAHKNSIEKIKPDDSLVQLLLQRKSNWLENSYPYIFYTKIDEIRLLANVKCSGYYRVEVNFFDYFPKYLLSAVYCYCQTCQKWSNLDFSFGCQRCNNNGADEIRYTYQYEFIVMQQNEFYHLELSYDYANLFFGYIPEASSNGISPDPGILLSEFRDLKKAMVLGIYFDSDSRKIKIVDTICFRHK